MRATADPARARDDIVLVTIDEESLRGLEPLVGRWPWPRLVHAERAGLPRASPAARGGLRRAVHRARPDEVLRQGRGVERRRFRRRAGGVARGVPWSSGRRRAGGARGRRSARRPASDLPRLAASPSHAEPRPVFVPPIAPLAAAGRAVAHNFAVLDADGPWRRYVPFCVIRAERFRRSRSPRRRGVGRGRRSNGRSTVASGRRPALPLAAAQAPDRRSRHAQRAPDPLSSRRPDGSSPYRRLSFYKLFYSEQQLLEGQTPSSARARCATRSSSSARRLRRSTMYSRCRWRREGGRTRSARHGGRCHPRRAGAVAGLSVRARSR